MQKKSIIAILSAVVLMVVASLALVFTVGPKTSADSEVIETVPVDYLNITNGVLGDGKTGGAFTADGKTWITEHAKYRVEIPAGVTSIGKNAFYGCSGLTTSITIPEGVTSIGEDAFCRCSGLASIEIPSSVTNIGAHAFQGCGFTSITLPLGVTKIDDFTFDSCKLLTSIVIPSSVTSIGKCAFADTAFTSVTIPSNITSIGRRAFAFCPDLISVTIPASVTYMEDEIFFNSGSLTSIYCEAESQPAGWNDDWKDGCYVESVWSYVIPEPEPETPGEETSTEVNNQNNNGLLWGILGTSGGILLIGVIVFGVVVAKRRRK